MVPDLLVNGIYRLIRRVSVGGMGEVWEARHERTKGRVALKLLLPEMGRHRDVLLRFQREVEITSGLNHPNIVRVSDADKMADGRPFLVMEFLEGWDLGRMTGQPMPLPQVIEIIEQIAMGLHAAHGRSIIHRDLKPANIFLVPLSGTTRPLVKILDFGISKALDGMNKLTHTRSVIGTPYYMAPEQAAGGISSMDARADQFSLAAITYELLTGHMAFEGDGVVNVLYKVVLEAPPTFASFGIDMPDGVEATVMRGLSKSASDRFASVLELSDALKESAGAPMLDAGRFPQVKPFPSSSTLPTALATPRTLRFPVPSTPTTLSPFSKDKPDASPEADRSQESRTARVVGKSGRRRTIGGLTAVASLVAIFMVIITLRGARPPGKTAGSSGDGAGRAPGPAVASAPPASVPAQPASSPTPTAPSSPAVTAVPTMAPAVPDPPAAPPLEPETVTQMARVTRPAALPSAGPIRTPVAQKVKTTATPAPPGRQVPSRVMKVSSGEVSSGKVSSRKKAPLQAGPINDDL